jgi:hypothetical protein
MMRWPAAAAGINAQLATILSARQGPLTQAARVRESRG